MFDETYMRIRHQERLEEVDHARLVRTLTRRNPSTQLASQPIAASAGYKRFWRLVIRGAGRQLATRAAI
jgi:hypothetical protein